MKTRFLFRIYHLAFILCSLAGTGCNLFMPRPEPPDAKAPPVPTGRFDTPRPEMLVNYLNGQADKLQSIETRDLGITVRSQGNAPPSLDGVLLVQQPRYLRLVGKSIVGQEVLVGSNQERFWFHVKRDPRDTMYYCSHAEYASGQSQELPFPFQPEWVLEALGMGRLDPNGTYRVEEDKTTYRLIEDAKLRGQPIRKVTVFHKGTAAGNQPQVKARMIYDVPQDRLICSATVKSVQRIALDRGAEKAIVPQVLKLEWPAQDTELILELGRVHVNRQLQMESFQMPRLGSKQVDLARDRPTSRGVVPAGFR